MTTTDLPTRVRATLHHHAAALEVDDVPFDSTAEPTVAAVVDLPEPRRRGRGVLLVAAAVVAVGLVAGAAIAADDDGVPDRDRTGPAATEGTAGPDPTAPPAAGPPVGLAPTSVPDGLELVVVGVEETDPHEAFATQLFASADGAARVRITAQTARGEAPGPGPTVRGVPAQALPSKEHPDRSSALSWREDPYAYTADHTGLAEAEAVAFLDGLVRRPDSPAFDAPPGDLDLVAEVPAGPVARRSTTLSYEGGGRRLDVRADELLDGSPEHDRVRDSYMGVEDDAGRLVAHDPRYDEVVVTWPDGRRVIATGDGSFGADALREVALSVEPVDEAGLDALRARVGAGDPAPEEDASAVPPNEDPGLDQLGPFTAMVRNAGGRGADLQLGARADISDPEAPRVCVLVEDVAACEPGPSPGVGSVLVDGHWYVAVVTRDPAVRITLGAPSPGADPVPVPGVTGGEVDGYVIWVAAVADDVDEVFVGTDLQFGNVLRPTG